MRTDGLHTIHEVRIPWASGRTLRVIPFGDVHRDSPSCSVDKWREFLTYARGLEDVMFLGMGDYLDGFSTSERAILYGSDLHESTLENLETAAKGRVSQFAAEVDFMKGRCLGILGGNHFPAFANGTTGDQLLAEKLGTRYLGASTQLRITFMRKCGKRQDQFAHVDIAAHHGKGGGTTAAGRMNAVERAIRTVYIADIMLMGDNHARGAMPTGQLVGVKHTMSGMAQYCKEQWIGRTGSFLKAYEPGRRSYVVDGCMSPSSLGWIEFLLTPYRKHDGETGVNIRCLQ